MSKRNQLLKFLTQADGLDYTNMKNIILEKLTENQVLELFKEAKSLEHQTSCTFLFDDIIIESEGIVIFNFSLIGTRVIGLDN